MAKRSVLPRMSVLLILAGFGCVLAFNLIGSSVDENGVLHEPFGLVPISGVCFLFGAIAGIVHGARVLLRGRR